MSGGRGSVPWLGVAIGAALLLAATPPAWTWWTPVLVVPGLAVQFALATGTRRPLLASYLLGALHIGAFSWSLRHVSYGGLLAIALLGGLYHVALATAVRRWPGRGALAFAFAVAGISWWRAEMPGIAYPHGQPIHDLWQAPLLLGAVRLGGEPLGNFLLAGSAAAVVACWRGWRTREQALSVALRGAACWCGASGLVAFVYAPVPRGEAAPTVAIAAIESGIHPIDAFADVDRGDRRAYDRRWRELFRGRLLEPTDSVAGAAAADAPALVLWPESAVPYLGDLGDDGSVRFDALHGVFALQPGTRVCLGGDLERHSDHRLVPAVMLVDERGEFVAHQEKQCLVPAGETLPFVEWLPAGAARVVREFLQTNVGLPVALPGRALPPLELPAAGQRPAVPFAALVCYDNAFPGVVAAAVARGARFVAVLSNEAWYRGGGELEQLAAITVLRAVATATPIVRCTTDGRTMAVDRDGRVLAELPWGGAERRAARVLHVDLPLGDGRLPPMAWLHPCLGWAALLAVVGPCLHALFGWARLLRLGKAPAAAGGGGSPRP